MSRPRLGCASVCDHLVEFRTRRDGRRTGLTAFAKNKESENKISRTETCGDPARPLTTK